MPCDCLKRDETKVWECVNSDTMALAAYGPSPRFVLEAMAEKLGDYGDAAVLQVTVDFKDSCYVGIATLVDIDG